MLSDKPCFIAAGPPKYLGEPHGIGAPKPDRDLEQDASAERVSRNQRDCEVIVPAQHGVERDRPGQFVLRRPDPPMHRTELVG